jgi:hypothetical protein
MPGTACGIGVTVGRAEGESALDNALREWDNLSENGSLRTVLRRR